MDGEVRLPATPASCETFVTSLEVRAWNAPSSTRIVHHEALWYSRAVTTCGNCSIPCWSGSLRDLDLTTPVSVREPCRPCARNKPELDQPYRDGFRTYGDTNKPPCANDPGQRWQPRPHTNAERAKQDTSTVVRRVRDGRGVIVGKFVGDQSALKRPERMVPGSDRIERDTPAPKTSCDIFDLVSKVV